MAMPPELPHKEAQTSVRTLLPSSGSRHMFEGACAGSEVAFLLLSRYEIGCVVTGLWLTALALASKL